LLLEQNEQQQIFSLLVVSIYNQVGKGYLLAFDAPSRFVFT